MNNLLIGMNATLLTICSIGKAVVMYTAFSQVIFFASCKKVNVNVNEVSGPVVSSIEPPRGVAGTTVTFKGAHFGKSISGNRVMFDRVEAIVSTASDTQLIVTAPAHDPGIVDVTIMVNGKESKAVAFEYE